MHRFMLAALVTLTTTCGASASDRSDTTAIESVIERFRQAIVEKDKPKFIDLFLHERITWQSVMSDEHHAREKRANPAAEKARYEPEKTPMRFIDDIVGTSVRVEEKFEGVRIDTDGAAASVAFDFEFLRNGSVVNAGREYWLLVKTGAGWKIASVVWSRHTPQRR